MLLLLIACSGQTRIYGGGSLSLTIDSASLSGQVEIEGIHADDYDESNLGLCEVQRPTAWATWSEAGADVSPNSWTSRPQWYTLQGCVDAESLGGDADTWVMFELWSERGAREDRPFVGEPMTAELSLRHNTGSWEPTTGGTLETLSGIWGTATLTLSELYEGRLVADETYDQTDQAIDAEVELSWSFHSTPMY